MANAGIDRSNVAGDDTSSSFPKTPTVGVPKHVKTGGRDLVPTSVVMSDSLGAHGGWAPPECV